MKNKDIQLLEEAYASIYQEGYETEFRPGDKVRVVLDDFDSWNNTQLKHQIDTLGDIGIVTKVEVPAGTWADEPDAEAILYVQFGDTNVAVTERNLQKINS